VLRFFRCALASLRLCVLLLSILFIAACDILPDEQPVESTWGAVVTVAQAQQTDAPVIWPQRIGFSAAWIGADDAGVHQDARRFNGAALENTVVMPLPPQRPHHQTNAPTPDNAMHLLWLDAASETGTRLYSAIIAEDFTVERGPTSVSNELTLNYAIQPLRGGSLLAVWSGNLAAEPSLYISRIDEQGRPRPGAAIVMRADYPALIAANDGTVSLFWLAVPDGTARRAIIVDNEATQITRITSGVTLEPGDRLVNFSAGLDDTHTYLFWNVTRADGGDEIWFTSGRSGTADWMQPQRLIVDVTLEAPLETGFGGSANLANRGITPMRWAAPLRGQYNMLAVAMQSDTHLGVAYFRAGHIIGWEAIVPVDDLVGLPGLSVDEGHDLLLTWSQPTDEGYANLNVATTRN
jgi:hypothetical protein